MLAIAALTGVVCLGATAPSMDLPLKPGVLTGRVHTYLVHRGDSLSAIALRYRVNPVRIRVPGGHGLRAGERVLVDTRRVEPTLSPDLAGVVVNIPEAEVYLVNARGQLERNYPVAVSVGDKHDPLGDTHVVCKVKNPPWVVPSSIQAEERKAGEPVKTVVSPGPDDPLGPRYMGFWDGTFGLHGTNEPYSIKHYVSHGCVRFLPSDIIDLYRRVNVGTPVHVLYQPVLLAMNRGHAWLTVYPDIYDLDYPFEAAVRDLAAQAGVSARLNWTTVRAAIARRNGIPVDATWPPVPRPTPTPKHAPASHTPRPAPSASAAPASATVAPSPTPVLASPSTVPSPAPVASGTPTPAASATASPRP